MPRRSSIPVLRSSGYGTRTARSTTSVRGIRIGFSRREDPDLIGTFLFGYGSGPSLRCAGEEEEQNEIDLENMEDADIVILDEDPSPAGAEKELDADEQQTGDSTNRDQEMAAEALAGPAVASSSTDKSDADNRIQVLYETFYFCLFVL